MRAVDPVSAPDARPCSSRSSYSSTRSSRTCSTASARDAGPAGRRLGGLGNYRHVFGDDLFWLSFRNTAVYALCGTVVSLAAGLGFALLLNARTGKISDAMGFLYTLPWVVSPVVAGFAWKWMLNDSFGILNYWLTGLSIVRQDVNWLGDPHTALPCVAVARVWQFYPFAMVMFLAGLQCIPREQYEAAEVDGATPAAEVLLDHAPQPPSRDLRPAPARRDLELQRLQSRFCHDAGRARSTPRWSCPSWCGSSRLSHFDLGKGSALSVLVFAMLFSCPSLYLRDPYQEGRGVKEALRALFMAALRAPGHAPLSLDGLHLVQAPDRSEQVSPAVDESRHELRSRTATCSSISPSRCYTVNSLVVVSSAAPRSRSRGKPRGVRVRTVHVPREAGTFCSLLLLSQMLPGASVIIPLFQLVTHADCTTRTRAGPRPYGGAPAVRHLAPVRLLLRDPPVEVEDAALIDGCSRLSALRRVILPLALPGLGATALFAFLGSWNEFFFALLLTTPTRPGRCPWGSACSSASIRTSGTRWRRRRFCSASRRCCCSCWCGRRS